MVYSDISNIWTSDSNIPQWTSAQNERVNKAYIVETSEYIWHVNVIHNVFYISNVTVKYSWLMKSVLDSSNTLYINSFTWPSLRLSQPSQTAKTIGSTSIRHRPDTFSSDRYLPDVDPELFVIRNAFISVCSGSSTRTVAVMQYV